MNPLLNMLGATQMNRINPMFSMISALKNSTNPYSLLEKMSNQNPQLAPFMNIIKGKNSSELKDTFYSLCKEKGINPEEFAKQLNVQLPN